MNQALIRQAAESDIQSISRLQLQWFEEGGVYGFVPESQEQVSAALSPYLLVAEAGKEVVGFVSGSIRDGVGVVVLREGQRHSRRSQVLRTAQLPKLVCPDVQEVVIAPAAA